MDAETKSMVEGIVATTISKFERDGFPFCRLENSRISNIEAQQTIIKRIVTGNGTPDEGLMSKHAILELKQEMDHKIIVEIKNGIRAIGLIGMGLILTSLWQIMVK